MEQPLSEELRDILNIIADLSHKDPKSDVKDTGVVEEAKHLPADEVMNYISQLESRGFVQLGVKAAGASFRLLNITKAGLEELDNQDLV